jgi:hypothetical protein
MKRGETEWVDGESGPQWSTLRKRRGPAVPCGACCGLPIEPGDLYVSIAGVWDGRRGRERLHRGCYAELERLVDESGEEVEFQRVAQYALEDARVFDPVAKEWVDDASALVLS